MNIVSVIRIEPELLIWARNRINMSIEDVSLRLKLPKNLIKSWEEGNSSPSYSQLEKLAYDVYKVPLAVFYLNKPPLEPPIKQEFRTIPESKLQKLPYDFMLQVRQGQFFQNSLNELFSGRNPIPVPLFHQIEKVDSNNIKDIALYIRKTLKIDKSVQTDFKDFISAFKYYRDSLERQGIFIFQQTLKDYCRGYSLYDGSFPIVLINSSEISYAGKSFTLFHELAHILFQTGGITYDVYSGSKQKIEVLCNELASLILIDKNDLKSDSRIKPQMNGEFDENLLKVIANEYKVSQEMLLRCLLDLGIVSQIFYNKKRYEWSIITIAKKRKGGDYYANKFSKIGKNYSSVVFTKLNNGQINILQASEYLGVKINQIQNVKRLVYK